MNGLPYGLNPFRFNLVVNQGVSREVPGKTPGIAHGYL
jgi:hypothetical protein